MVEPRTFGRVSCLGLFLPVLVSTRAGRTRDRERPADSGKHQLLAPQDRANSPLPQGRGRSKSEGHDAHAQSPQKDEPAPQVEAENN